MDYKQLIVYTFIFINSNICFSASNNFSSQPLPAFMEREWVIPENHFHDEEQKIIYEIKNLKTEELFIYITSKKINARLRYIEKLKKMGIKFQKDKITGLDLDDYFLLNKSPDEIEIYFANKEEFFEKKINRKNYEFVKKSYIDWLNKYIPFIEKEIEKEQAIRNKSCVCVIL